MHGGERDYFITALTAAIIVIVGIAFLPLLNSLIVGISVAVVLMPLQRRCAAVTGPILSSALVTISVFVFAFFAVFSTLSVLALNAGYLEEMVVTISEWIKSLFHISTGISSPILMPDLTPITSALILDIQRAIFGFLAMMPMAIVEMIVFFLTVYIFLIIGDRVWADVRGMVPGRSQHSFAFYGQTVADTLYSILVVHIAIAVITFLLALPFFAVLGYGHIVFFSVLSGLLAMIPVIGPVVLFVFLGVYALALGDWRGLFLLALVGYPLVCGLTDLYLRPVLMGRRIEIRPVFIFLAFFGGMAVMGLMGFILGPLFVALLLAAYRVMVEEYGSRDSGEGVVDMSEKASSSILSKVSIFLRRARHRAGKNDKAGTEGFSGQEKEET